MFKEKTYSFSEFKEIYYSDNKIKQSHLLMPMTVSFYTASVNATCAMGAGTEMGDLPGVANEIIDMVLLFGRYGCLGMGAKCMIENMLQGANLKEATAEGLQYFIFYILLMLYPKLFAMIKF